MCYHSFRTDTQPPVHIGKHLVKTLPLLIEAVVFITQPNKQALLHIGADEG